MRGSSISRFRNIAVAAVSLWAAHLAVPSGAAAQDDFFRSSPGALSQSHAHIDGQANCNECHSGGRAVTDQKCLDCHDHRDLKERIDAGKGFHASSVVKGRKCDSCHLEHRGRNFDLMGWRQVGGMENFDHALTGWKLQGKHTAIECSDCHTKRNKQGLRTFLGEDSFCGSCHKRDQPHGFERREMMDCARCHSNSAWTPPLRRMRFDHNDPKQAGMGLVGSHEDVLCGKCHPKAQFNLKRKDPDSCAHCHSSPHDGHLFGEKKCDWCHSPQFRSLPRIQFNHAARTRFDLAGAHGRLQCYECHTQRLGKRAPNRACEQCHAEDNRHKQRFQQFGDPPRCATCHPSSAWTPSVFNHNRNTKFALTGKHAAADCRQCHRGRTPSDFERFDPRKVGCMGCHQHSNVHDGEFADTDCLRCHTDAGVVQLTKKSVEIYHGPKSRFPLVKKHKDVPCVQCHVNDVYMNTPAECGVRCHEDSLHRGSLGDQCSRCHSGGEWEPVRFDHDVDTNYPMVGLHRTVPQCADCHPARQFSGTPQNCSAEGCHAKDDAHRGRLGDACEQCHLETGQNIFNHNTMSRFKLDGQHMTTRCSECHPSITFKPRPVNCFGCHPEPDVHRGQYGTVCETCHNTSSFADIKPMHDVGDFSLRGAHDNLACDRCHLDNRPLGGSGNLCINCHRQDDIHNNSLSPRCGECHTQWSFAPARFDHSTVGCNLTGLHRTLPCYDCHKAGNFGGLIPTCFGCHIEQALQSQVQNHAGFTDNCTTCHNPNAWSPAVQGVTNYGRESVCR